MTPAARAELVALDRKHVWHPYTPVDDPREPLVVTAARGARLTLADGRTLLDGNSSWWVAGLGHGHPRLVAALRAQAETLCHVAFAGLTHEPAVRLAAELAEVAPPGLTRVFYSDDGSTAVEAALKLAVQFHAQTGAPRRTKIVALADAFHGETAGAASLGGVELFRRASAPLTFEALRLPTPAPGAAGGADADATCARALAAAAERFAARADEIAALVVEPLVQGAAGMAIHAPRFLAEARALCDRHGVLLVADEVFTGYGRTGAMWACDHASVVPDLLCAGKTFSGGLLPFAATLVHERLAAGFTGGRERAFLHGHSYSGNPLGAAVARAALAVMRDEAVVAGVQRRAPRLAEAARAAARAAGLADAVCRPRALGFVAALDLGGGSYLGGAGWRVYDQALARGAYLRPLGDTVYLAPPLTISDAELDELCDIFVAAVGAATSEGGTTP